MALLVNPETQRSQPIHRGIEILKMYAIKLIKMCAVQHTASGRVPNKPALALGIMSRYSTQLLICIVKAIEIEYTIYNLSMH